MTVRRLFDLIPQQIAKYPKDDALATKENGAWITYSSERVQETRSQSFRQIGLNGILLI